MPQTLDPEGFEAFRTLEERIDESKAALQRYRTGLV